MTAKQISEALEKRGYRLEKACKCAGMYDIYYKKMNVAYLYNSPSKGTASIQLIGTCDNEPKVIETPKDLFWYLP